MKSKSWAINQREARVRIRTGNPSVLEIKIVAPDDGPFILIPSAEFDSNSGPIESHFGSRQGTLACRLLGDVRPLRFRCR